MDVTDTRNRVLHHATFLAAFLLLSFAGVFAVAVNKSYSAPSASLQSKWIVCAIAGVSLGIWSVRIKRRLRWEVPYKGHRIVFDAGGMFAEQLFIDDGLVKLGGFGLKMEIRAAIKAGAGNGDTIVVWYDARYLYCRCRIVAEEAMLTK